LNAASEKAMSAGMTPERLLALWKATSKALTVQRKLATQTGPALKAYQKAVERHEERVKTLASKASKSLSDSDLDKLLTNMDDDDYTSPYGFYVVAKIEALRADRGDTEDDDCL
jgi:pyruvate/oxaloacetate carboxyltransferase